MSKNPFLNAISASLYISLVASVVYYGPKFAGHIDDSVIAPIAFLSLFVLSAATMGVLFFYRPIQFYIDGEKKEAMNLFLKTVAVFAAITALVLFSLLMSGE